MQESRDAVEEATDEAESQREAQARTHEREEDTDCEALSDDTPWKEESAEEVEVEKGSRAVCKEDSEYSEMGGGIPLQSTRGCIHRRPGRTRMRRAVTA